MEYGGSKPKKIDWMKQYFKSEQPPAGIVQQAKRDGWLQTAALGKADNDIEWKDFKAKDPGLDSVYYSIPDDDEDGYVPDSPKYNPHGPGVNDDLDLGGAAMQQGMMQEQEPEPPTPEVFSGKEGRRHNYTITEKREIIGNLNKRVPEHPVALGGSLNHNQANAAYSTLYGNWLARQQQQQQEQGFFGMQPPLQGQQQGMPIHPMMQQSASSSNQGASKQGSSKDGSSKEDVPVIPINLPGINEPFNPPPTSTAVMEAGASNDEKTRRVFAELRVGMKAMSNQQSSADILNSRRKLMADITSYGTPQRYFDAANSVFLCLTGRTKPADGQVTALQIEGPQGPMDLIGPNGPTQAGFTTYVVSEGENYTTPPIENYGCYPILANDLLGPVEQRPGSINAIELVGDAKKRYIIQLPMSHEGGGNTPNNPMRETRLNVCFFMNPTELQNLMDEGLFHHLEYYSDNFMPSFNYRYQQLRAEANGFKQQVLAMMKAITETFTSVPSFTADAQVKAGNPDAMYLYMGFKFYITKIMELTNELTELNNKMAENSENQQILDSLKPSQEALYKKLVDLIYEMDVWNFIIQTVPDGKLATNVGYWNFSAFGISRAPRLEAGDEILASYKNRTKPWSCYPRCLYQTFYQLQQVEDIQELAPILDQAVDAAVSQFNHSNPSALDLIRFGNTQSVLRYAFLNRAEMKNLDPDAKLKMLDETQATKGKTVREAMEEQNASNSILKTFIARAAGMNPQTFLQLTGQEKSAIRAQRYITELQNQRRKAIPAFNNNDIVELPQVEQQKQLESTVNKKQFHSTMSVAAQASNPRIIIVNINLEGEHIMYTYRRIDSQNRVISDGQGDKQIQEHILLGSKKNVAIANTNLVKRAVQVSSSSQSTAGLTVQDAARILGRQHFRQSDLSVDYEVAFYNSKLQELSQKELFDSNGPTEFARRADGVTLMMSEQLREQQRQMQEIKNLIKNHAQVAALTKQQAKEYWSDPSWQQEYYYQKYQLYRKKFNALQKSWNILASLDAIVRAPNGDRPPLDTWTQVTVGQIEGQVSDHGPLSIPIRVINTGWCLRAFDLATRVALPVSLANMAQQLRTRVFGSTQTLAETWNNGRILSFGEWATRDEELSNREQTQAARGGKLLTDYDQTWYDEYVMRKEEEKQRAMEEQRRQDLEERQQAVQAAREAQQQQREGNRDRDGEDFLTDERRKQPANQSSSSTTSSSKKDGGDDDDDDSEMDTGQGGGNRKKKTRKRKKKTKRRRRKKMKGGKKTKNKRKKKNKSKTRRKTGGEDGPQVTVDPNEGKVQSNKKIVTEADNEKMLRILKLV